jgi:UDP-3-O-[3-hydroxymyristoyl] glucosamine N-acyltransferase
MVGPMTVIGPDVRIGRDCAIGPGASVLNALIGDRVVVRSGCRLGDENPTGAAPADRRVAQFGRVILQDGVQLGANCTIDRGSYLDTVVGEHTLIDNLVRIPANISIGRHCRISLLHGSKTSAAELLSDGVVPDHTATDARSIASFGSR